MGRGVEEQYLVNKRNLSGHARDRDGRLDHRGRGKKKKKLSKISCIVHGAVEMMPKAPKDEAFSARHSMASAASYLHLRPFLSDITCTYLPNRGY